MAGGFNVVDFMDLPPLERGIVRLVLRDITLSHTRLLQVVTTERNIDAASVEDALDHLTLMQWLICQGSGQNKFYRVNTRQKVASTGAQCIWDDLDLDGIKMPGTPQISMGGADTTVTAPESTMTVKSGSKRHLPQQIWDRLDSPAKDTPNDSAAPAAKSMRRASLFDKLGDDGSSSKTQ